MESFIIYKSIYEALLSLPLNDFRDTFTAIGEYALYNNDVSDCLSPQAKIVMNFCKPLIDSNVRKYERRRKASIAEEKAPKMKRRVTLDVESTILEEPAKTDYVPFPLTEDNPSDINWDKF